MAVQNSIICKHGGDLSISNRASSLFDARRHDLGESQTSKINFAYFARTLVNGFSLFIRNLHPQVKSMVTFEDGKIVTVQTAIKEGQKSTR